MDCTFAVSFSNRNDQRIRYQKGKENPRLTIRINRKLKTEEIFEFEIHSLLQARQKFLFRVNILQ